jgi:extracellular factor (EF) 3-hydroxypalmitic acid methyl ester biosynthesis protein
MGHESKLGASQLGRHVAHPLAAEQAKLTENRFVLAQEMFHPKGGMNWVFTGNGNGSNGHLQKGKSQAAPPPAAVSPSGSKESFVTFKTAEGVKLQGTLSRVTRHIAVFELYNPGVPLRFSEVLGEFTIVMQSRAVYSGRAVASKVLDAGTKVVCEVILEAAQWADVSSELLARHGGQIAEEFKQFIREWQRIYKVLPEFKVVIADMQTFLQELHLWMEQLEAQLRALPQKDRDLMEPKMVEETAKEAIPLINVFFERFEALAGKISDDQMPMHGRYMRQHLHHLVLSAPFAKRTFEKPLGYAGDYEMVNMIVRNGFEGNSLFAKILHSWFVRQPPAEAHRNRIKFLTERLELETQRIARRSDTARIFNFACGPAVEVQHFMRSPLSEHAELTLADFSSETLQYIGGILDEIKELIGRRTAVCFQQKNVYQLLKESQKSSSAHQPQFDFVYCAGLFDYLTDHTCKQLMNIFYDSVAPGGLLVATNVEPSNPLRHGMEQLLDWHLIYRNEQEMRELTPSRASKENVVVRTDPTGVNLFMEVRKPAHD